MNIFKMIHHLILEESVAVLFLTHVVIVVVIFFYRFDFMFTGQLKYCFYKYCSVKPRKFLAKMNTAFY